MNTMVIYHNESSVKTIKDLMDYKRIFETDNFTYKTFFDENRTRIFQQLSNKQKSELAVKKYGEDASIDDLKEEDLDYNMTLPFPCTLLIKTKYVSATLAVSETNFQENTDDFFVFENSQIKKIITNEGYKVNKNTRKQKPDVKVFGWFKSFYYAQTLKTNGTFYRSKNNTFIDISKYIQEIYTNVSQTGGTFRISLPMINTERGVRVEKAYISEDVSEIMVSDVADEINSIEFSDFFIHKSTVQDFDKTMFNWMIQNNDLLFISFGDDIRSMEDDIGMRCFDMIGLVDEVSVNQNANGNGNITVSGRDLMKLITDDSSLFFNKSTAWGGSNIFANTESYQKSGDILSTDTLGGEISPINRLRRYITNEINIFAYPTKTLDFVIKGVIQKLVNIEIVPDFVFEGWGDRRTKFNELEYKEVVVKNGDDNNNQQDEELNKNINKNVNRKDSSTSEGTPNHDGFVTPVGSTDTSTGNAWVMDENGVIHIQ